MFRKIWEQDRVSSYVFVVQASGNRRRKGTPRMAGGRYQPSHSNGPTEQAKQVVTTPEGRVGGKYRGLTWSARCDPSGQKWPGLQTPVHDDAVDSWDDPKRPEGHGKDVPPTQ